MDFQETESKKNKIPNSKHLSLALLQYCISIHSSAFNNNHNFYSNLHGKWSIQIKNISSKYSFTMYQSNRSINPNVQHTHSDFGVLKFIVILILIGVVILLFGKFRKSRKFKGQLFSNMVKIKLFIADTQSYVPLDLNKIAGNVHLFKLTGALLLENVTLWKSWIWDVLEIYWSNVHVTLNEKEINLSISFVIPLVYKLKIRWLFKKRTCYSYTSC